MEKWIKIGPRKEKIPFRMQIYKSLSYLSVSHQFATFLLTSPKVKALHRYLSTALMPDEEFYATAYMLPEAPTAHRIRFDDILLMKALSFQLGIPAKHVLARKCITLVFSMFVIFLYFT